MGLQNFFPIFHYIMDIISKSFVANSFFFFFNGCTPARGVKKHGHVGVAISQILQHSGDSLPFRHCFLFSDLSLRIPGTWLFLEQSMSFRGPLCLLSLIFTFLCTPCPICAIRIGSAQQKPILRMKNMQEAQRNATRSRPLPPASRTAYVVKRLSVLFLGSHRAFFFWFVSSVSHSSNKSTDIGLSPGRP